MKTDDDCDGFGVTGEGLEVGRTTGLANQRPCRDWNPAPQAGACHRRVRQMPRPVHVASPRPDGDPSARRPPSRGRNVSVPRRYTVLGARE